MSKEITIMQFRKTPGEFIHEVSQHGRSFVITKVGKPVARLVPISDITEILPDGTTIGELPPTRLIGNGAK